MVQHEGHSVVVVAASDAVASMPRNTFLELADSACQIPGRDLPSPVIPNAYDLVARWQMGLSPTPEPQQMRLTRRQLAMAASLMTLQASRHPNALNRQPLPVEQILVSPLVAPCTTVLECAK